MPVMPTVAPKHNTDAPRVAYISFPPPAASVTGCSNQPVKHISSYLGALLIAELLASYFSFLHCGEGNCSILDFILCPKPESH